MSAPILFMLGLGLSPAFGQEPPSVVVEISPPPIVEVVSEPGAIEIDAVVSSGEERAELLGRRINELEARLEEMEGQLHDRQAKLEEEPGTVRHGGVVVEPHTRVEEAVGLAGPVDVYGEVAGDAVSIGSDVRIRDGGRVEGNAVSFGGRVEVDPGGVIVGDRVALGAGSQATAAMGYRPLEGSSIWQLLQDAVRRVALLLSMAGAGVLVVGLWPDRVRRVAADINERPLWTGVAGAILVASLSVATLALTLTLIGIPVAMLLSGVLGLAWLFGLVAICFALGERFTAARERGAWAAFLAGAALLAFVGMLPWVGSLTLVLVGFPAVGASLLTRLGAEV